MKTKNFRVYGSGNSSSPRYLRYDVYDRKLLNMKPYNIPVAINPKCTQCYRNVNNKLKFISIYNVNVFPIVGRVSHVIEKNPEFNLTHRQTGKKCKKHKFWQNQYVPGFARNVKTIR